MKMRKDSRGVFYEAQYELRKAEVKAYVERTDSEFTKYIIKRHKLMLQELLDCNSGAYNHRQQLTAIAGHYNTLQMCGSDAEIPDELMAELILERLV